VPWHLLLAQLDQRRAQLLLAVGVEPVRIPLVAEPPERLSGPHLLVGHQASNRTASKEEVLTTRSSQRSKSARPCSSISATRSSTARSIASPPIVRSSALAYSGTSSHCRAMSPET